MSTTPLTFAVATNNRQILEANFLSSPALQNRHSIQILIQQGFSSAAAAYNDAINHSTNDLIVFAHQDVIFPELWISQLTNAIDYLEHQDVNWAVLGPYGETRDFLGRGHIYSSGLGVMGKEFAHPTPVQTLDEIVLVIRKSSGLRFDPNFPHFHLYGADLCTIGAQMGMTSYAIPAFCIHNTDHILVLPKEYYECYQYFRKKWKDILPIQTTCLRITRSGVPMYRRKLSEMYLQYVRRVTVGAVRAEDAQQLLRTLTISTK